ncbi:hypothetical protein SeMB42_g03362 [Synchytrium endobioticum]|uniref:VOC domain-containing protein n=1 Tax=Synchytrium endobioticum TaxID=286115 RepID=A0A507D0E5_9FUNG|nr:hypothetical protein SeLEV6574_g04236 [Synchytrium endobioticum]TPX47336.1 hypothetical protein SeMB42_g03362 [Synchytrium endobioticum]
MERHETRLPVNDSVFCGSGGKWRFQEAFPDPVHTGRSHHVALRTEDLEAVMRLLQTRNIPYHLRVIPGYGGVRQLFFYDPDGNGIEFGEFAVLQPAFHEAAMIENEAA